MTVETAPLALDLPPGVLAALMDLADPGAGSVCRRRLGAAVPLAGPVVHRLAGVGAIAMDGAGRPSLTPHLQQACRVLASPLSHSRLRIWQGDEGVETAVYFPDVSSTRPGVGLTPVGDQLRLTMPVSADAQSGLVEELFLSKSAAAGSEFRVLLDADAARAFFGVLDWIRCGGGEVLDAGAGGRVVWFDPEQARSHHASGVALSSGLLFAPYVRMSLGADRDFDKGRWDMAISRLRKLGVLAGAPGGLALTRAVRGLAHTSTVLERALEWSVARRVADDSIEVVSRIVLALGGHLLLSLDRVDADLLLHTPSVDEVRADLAHSEPPVESRPRSGGFCRKCGFAKRPGKAFCVSCGASAT